MKALKYVSLVEIGPIVFDLWETKIGNLTSCVSNTLVCLCIFLGRSYMTVCLDALNILAHE